MKKIIWVLLILVSGCTTGSYIRENGERVVVKKFLGIPYLEKDTTKEWEILDSQAKQKSGAD